MSWGAVAGAVIGGGLSMFGQKQQRDWQEKQIREGNMGGSFFGPGVPYGQEILDQAAGLGRAGLLSPNADPLARLGRQNQLGYAQGLLPELVGKAHTGWQQALSGGINPYTTHMIQSAQNDMLQDFNRYTMPALADKAQAAGGFGGGRQGVAQGIAAEGLTEAMGDVSANMLNNAWNTAQQQQARAWGAAPTMFSAGLLPGGIQEQIGQTEGGIPLENLTNWNALTTPWAAASGSQGGVANAGSPSNMINAGVGGALTGAGLGRQLGGWLSGSSSTGNVPGDAYMPAQQYYGMGGPGSSWMSGLFGSGTTGGGAFGY